MKNLELSESSTREQTDKIAYSISGFCEAASVSRAFVYTELAAGHLESIHVGKRRLIPRSAAEKWLTRYSKR